MPSNKRRAYFSYYNYSFLNSDLSISSFGTSFNKTPIIFLARNFSLLYALSLYKDRITKLFHFVC